jgi:hypothetical protein
MAIVRNINTNDLYRYLGDNRFRNIRTGKEGVVSDEMAKEIFKISVEATAILNEYPNAEEMIRRLNLKADSVATHPQ